MSSPYLAEIRLVSFAFAPKGWAPCNGQTMSIQQNAAIFALLGTTYGGNGQTTFNLPDLRGRAPIHFGNGFTQGQVAGENAHTLTLAEMPSHTHVASGRPTGSTGDPTGAMWAGSTATAFGAATNLVAMSAGAAAAAGSSQAHDNMPPYQVLNWIIALQGIFPSRN